jgi:hypothetical protein
MNDSNQMKIVGRRVGGSGLSSKHDSKAFVREWRRALPTPMVPKGVYRFKTHEEADEWLWNQLTQQTNP